MEIDAAGKVHAKRDQLVARPSHVSDVEPRRGPDFLDKTNLVAEPIELVPRPRKRHEPRQLPDVAHLELHVHEPAPVPSKCAHLTDDHTRSFVQPAERAAIETR